MKAKLYAIAHALASPQARPAEMILLRLILAAIGAEEVARHI
jgi:hypothetical protein